MTTPLTTAAAAIVKIAAGFNSDMSAVAAAVANNMTPTAFALQEADKAIAARALEEAAPSEKEPDEKSIEDRVAEIVAA